MPERMCNKENSFLVSVKSDTAILEINIVVYQKNDNQCTSRPSYTNLGYIPKGCSIILQGHLLDYVYSSIIYNSQNLETI